MEKDMQEVLKKAEVLVEALPYIQRFNRKIIVVKYGGSAMSDETLQRNVITDVTLLKLVGFKPIIVHGGGKAISKWVGKVGKEAEFVNGLRVTDAETMEIAEMVLSRVNKQLVTMVQELGVKAVGISGKDSGLLRVHKKLADGKDIGYVGEIEQVYPKVLYDLLENDYLPIVAPIGIDAQYDTYNINADDAACAIATAVGADKLAFLTDIEGVYRDINDKSTFISRLTVSEADAMIREGRCRSLPAAPAPSRTASTGCISWTDAFPTACCWRSSPGRVSGPCSWRMEMKPPSRRIRRRKDE